MYHKIDVKLKQGIYCFILWGFAQQARLLVRLFLIFLKLTPVKPREVFEMPPMAGRIARSKRYHMLRLYVLAKCELRNGTLAAATRTWHRVVETGDLRVLKRSYLWFWPRRT